MQKRLVGVALEVLAIPALGLAAYGIAHSVSDSPQPQVILPAGSHQPSTTTAAPHGAAGDSEIHTSTAATSPGDDAGDHHGSDTPTAATGRGHDVGDDHGVDTSTTTPNSANINTPDDHGGATTTGTTELAAPVAPAPAAPTTSVADNRGGGPGTGGSPDGPSKH